MKENVDTLIVIPNDKIFNIADKKTTFKQAFEMIDKAIARHEYEVYKDGNKIGYVTSGCVAPTINKNIGLAYVDVNADVKVDTVFQIMVRNKLYNAKVVKRPFITKRNNV